MKRIPTRALALTLLAVAASLAAAHPSDHGISLVARADVANYYDSSILYEDDYQLGGDSDTMTGSLHAHVSHADAWANADLTTGALHLNTATSVPSGPTLSEVVIYSEVWDTFTFTNNSNHTITSLPFDVQFDGVVSGNGDSHFEYYGGTYVNTPWNAGSQTYVVHDNLLYQPVAPGQSLQVGFDVVADIGCGSTYMETSGSSADFSHTLKFSWDLPTGLSYTSASGHFVPQAVPEPASVAALGLGAIGLLRRRLRGR